MVGQIPTRILLTALLIPFVGTGMRAAVAQQVSQPQQPQQIQPPQQPQFQTQVQPQQQSAQWATMPRMLLERQFAGPLQDTIVQRWRDPADGTVCYIYLPITAPHSPPTASGFVQYGGNMIGSISCMPSPPASHAAASPRHPATAAQGQ
ncbi:hypothetical protein ACQR1W_14255 [Bradyrhizobium sp. HKCCYLS1011]|uniref:hypothetical protein n=1 Tax=Bradyrhizobium sp. HKCCYLS1011 TaxID=3420733 RepID=UPI003EBBFC20